MDKAETLAIMAVLRAAYPRYYVDMSRADAEGIVTLWAELFRDEPAKLVAAAVKALISGDTKGFPPHIGAVKEYMARLTHPNEMTEMEAWGHVSKAIRNSLYNSVEEFEKLPEAVRGVVASATQLRAWAMVDADAIETVIQSNFMRSFRVRSQSVRDYQKLPQAVKDFAGTLADAMRMPELPEGNGAGVLPHIAEIPRRL